MVGATGALRARLPPASLWRGLAALAAPPLTPGWQSGPATPTRQNSRSSGLTKLQVPEAYPDW